MRNMVPWEILLHSSAGPRLASSVKSVPAGLILQPARETENIIRWIVADLLIGPMTYHQDQAIMGIPNWLRLYNS